MSDTYSQQMDSLLNPVSSVDHLDKFRNVEVDHLDKFRSSSPQENISSNLEENISSSPQENIYADWTEEGAIAWAGYMGTIDTIRGVKQIVGWDRSLEEKDQRLLNSLMEHPEWGNKVKAAWFGGMILDPVGWLVPIAKARTAGRLAWEGFKWGGIQGALGYVDEESSNRLMNTAQGAVGGAVLLGGGKKALDISRRIIKGKERFEFENVPISQLNPEKQEQLVRKLAQKAFPDELVDIQPEFRAARITSKQGESIIDFTSQRTAKELLSNPEAAIRGFTGHQPKRIADNIKKFYFAPFQTAQEKYYNFTTNKLYKPVFGNPVTSASVAAAGVAGMSLTDDYIQGVVDRYEDENDVDTGVTSQALIGLSAILSGTTALVAGKGLRKIPQVRTNMDKASDFFGRMFIDNYKLPPIYKKLKDDIGIDVNTYENKFFDIATRMSMFDPDEKRILYQFMDGQHRVGDIAGKIPKELHELGDEAREQLKILGQEMVDIGLLNRETFLRNINSYIHRTYVRKEIPDLLADSSEGLRTFAREQNDINTFQSRFGLSGDTIKHRGIPFKVRLTDTNQIKELEALGAQFHYKNKTHAIYRKPLTKEQRKYLGEVEDAAWAVKASGQLMSEDYARYKFFKGLVDQGMSISSRDFDSLPINKKQYWIRMSDDKIPNSNVQKWGALAGRYVPKEVHDDLKIQQLFIDFMRGRKDNPALEFIRRFAITYRKWNRRWKRGKTTWNPTVHGHNTFSNFTVLDGHDVPAEYLAKFGLKVWSKAGQKALNENKEFGPIYDDLVRLNVFDASLLKADLGMNKEDFLKIYSEETLGLKMNDMGQLLEKSSNIGGRIWETLRKGGKILGSPVVKADRLFGKWYQAEDGMFRAALYIKRLEEGMPRLNKLKKGTPEYEDAFEKIKRSAAAEARKGFVDYNISAPAVQALRETVLPFLAYPYRMIPILAEMATKKPHKFAKWASIFYAIDYMGSEASRTNEQYERALLDERSKATLWGLPLFPSSYIKVPQNLPKEFEKFTDKRFDISFGFDLDKDIVTGKPIPQRSLYWDVMRILPAGDAIGNVSPTGAGGGILPGFPAWMQPSGGLGGDIFSIFFWGTDLFTLKPIPTKVGNERADMAERLHYFLKKQVPNNPILGISGWQWGIDQIPGVEYKQRWRAFDSYAHQSIMRTLTQSANARAPYAEDTTVLNTMLRFIGIKLWPFELPFKEGKYRLEHERNLNKLQSEIIKLRKNLEKYPFGSEEYLAVEEETNDDILILRRKQEEYMLKMRGIRRLRENVEDPREIWESQQ